jgi:hypothetical protein
MLTILYQKLVYFRDIFEKSNTLNPRMQGNDTNIIIMTEKADIYWEVGLVGQKTRRKTMWKQVTLELISYQILLG